MSKEKPKKIWRVECMMCETTLDLDAGEYKIISTDQCAEFIQQPSFICGKCRSVCVVGLMELQEKESRYV